MTNLSHDAPMKRYGKLDVVEVSGNNKCVILFHGYGADANDLASLSEVRSVPTGTRWIFPNGPLEVPIAPGFMGRAWFQIDVEELDRDLRNGTYRDRSKKRPPGLDRAVALAFDMIDQLGTPKSQIIVGGFSQGAMLATELVMSSADPFGGLIVLSGTLLDEKNWRKKAQEKAGFPFFQSHGIQDPVLPYDLAQELNSLFNQAEWKGEFIEFRGGHEIPFKVVERMGKFIEQF